MSQYGIKSGSWHTHKSSTLVRAHTHLRCTWGIERPLPIKCHNSSSYGADKNRCTVVEAAMIVVLLVLCSGLQELGIDCADEQWQNLWWCQSKFAETLLAVSCTRFVSQNISFFLGCSSTSDAENESTCKLAWPLMLLVCAVISFPFYLFEAQTSIRFFLENRRSQSVMNIAVPELALSWSKSEDIFLGQNLCYVRLWV